MAKPFLERWMHRQVGWEGLVERLKNEAPRYVQLLPDLPRLIHQALQPRTATEQRLLETLLTEQRRTQRWLLVAVSLMSGVLIGLVAAYFTLRLR